MAQAFVRLTKRRVKVTFGRGRDKQFETRVLRELMNNHHNLVEVNPTERREQAEPRTG